MAWYTDMIGVLREVAVTLGEINIKVTPTVLSAVNSEAITVDNTVTILTPATYDEAVEAYVTVTTFAFRYRLDGTDPTDTVGHYAEAGDSFAIESAADIANFKAIRVAGDSATIYVTYFE